MADAALFEPHRPRLFALAYRMLGSVADAEDVVQDAFLRWHQRAEPVDNPAAFLTTIVTRLAIDHLRSARVQRETYVGPWLPEPLVTAGTDRPAELADTLATAFLLLLERLNPTERAVLLLHDVFGYPFDDVAEAVEKTPVHCRQIARRARQRVRAERPRFQTSAAARDRLVAHFLTACREGDVDGLRALLADDATLFSDGGGQVVAALRPLHGADRIIRFLLGIIRKAPEGLRVEPTELNGQPGFLVATPHQVDSAWALEVVAGQIRALYVVRNPDKLRHLDA